jgi:hypothetical protein
MNIIPSTAPFRYLSGMAALNIPSDSGTGDWHLVETFFRPRKVLSRLFVTGAGCPDDTTPLLSNIGVYECSSVLDQYRIPRPAGAVYAATHARAIADMVLITALDGGSLAFIRLDDWMPGDEDKWAVFDLLDNAVVKMKPPAKDKIGTWIAANSN